MGKGLHASTAGIRFHQFVTGCLPAMAYLAEWVPPLWVALGLSVLAAISDRLVILDWPLRNQRHPYDREDPGPPAGLFRLDEILRVVLLGTGLGLLATGNSLGWLPSLGAAAASIMEGTTAFSFSLLAHTLLLRLMPERFRAGQAADDDGTPLSDGNPNCIICQTLRTAPYGRCRWCRLSSIRWCCGLQTSLLMVLLLVIAFLLTTTLAPAVTKLLVTLSIVSVVTLSLAISRQTDDMIGTMNNLEEARRRTARRCLLLERLALADSMQEAAQETVAHVAEALGAHRVSVMVIEDDVLRIAASRGIPEELATNVAVPVPNRICGRVFESGMPLVLNDISREGMLETLGLDAGDALASFPLVTAPMKTGRRKIGVINVTDRPGGPFSEEDLAELQFAAEVAAISLSSQIDRRDLERGNYAAIRSLALAIEAKDPCTHGHSLRVQVWATAVARELGLSGPRLQTLTHAAELHDIGKIAIPDEILKAPRKLTAQEWAIVQEHPRRGVEMIRHLEFLGPARDAILYHHERIDGRGYPDGLAGEDIPLEARILGVVDAYDAMTSARPYRPPLSHEEAAEELRRWTGAQFDSKCVEAFLGLVGEEVQTVGARAWTLDPS